MAGIPISFNPWTVLDSNDPGDVIGNTKSNTKQDAAAGKKPAAAGPWAALSKAMEASTPSKKQYKKKLPAAAARDQANKKGLGAAKQNGAGKGTSKNGVY